MPCATALNAPAAKMRAMKSALAVLMLLAGCSNTAWQLSAGTPHVHSNVQVHASSGLATALGLSILAASVYEVSRGGLSFANDTSRPPEMDRAKWCASSPARCIAPTAAIS